MRDAAPSLISGEKDLPNHLKGEHEKDRVAGTARARENLDDYALSEAVNLLKGLALRHAPGTSTQNTATTKN